MANAGGRQDGSLMSWAAAMDCQVRTVGTSDIGSGGGGYNGGGHSVGFGGGGMAQAEPAGADAIE
jgi:hypothetical protein